MRLALLLALILLPGCAADRYLTVEQDAEMKEKCTETGCVVVPAHIWRGIVQMLRRGEV